MPNMISHSVLGDIENNEADLYLLQHLPLTLDEKRVPWSFDYKNKDLCFTNSLSLIFYFKETNINLKSHYLLENSISKENLSSVKTSLCFPNGLDQLYKFPLLSRKPPQGASDHIVALLKTTEA